MRITLQAIAQHPAVRTTVVIVRKYGPERRTIADTLHVGIAPAAALVAFEWGSPICFFLALISVAIAKHLKATDRKARPHFRRHPPRGE